MASNSGRKYGSSGRSGPRKRVVIGADETVRVRYKHNEPQVEAERRLTPRQERPNSGRVGSTTSKQAQRVSAAKKLERERKQRSLRLRRTVLYVGTALVLLVVAWGCIALYRAPIFSVRNIEVVGVSRLDEETVIRLAALPADATLLRTSGSQIEQRIERNPWVAEATVEKSYPSTLRLKVTERETAAVVDAGGTNLWVISRDGYWLGRQTGEDEGMLDIRDIKDIDPIPGRQTASKELLNALKVIAGLSAELREDIKLISAPTIDRTALITSDDVEVFVGEAADIAAKDRIIREILESKQGEVVYINVRVVDSPIWRGLEERQ